MQIDLASSTHQRLLDAAFHVCSERGLHAATTREIAETAQVNEVTLFRHFGSKEKLIGALFARVVEAQTEAFADVESTANHLDRDLARFAHRYHELLLANEALIRAIIGEARRHPEHARRIICDASKPMRARLLEYLQAGQKAGRVRRDLDLAPAVDAFTGMLLSGMLRRTALGELMEYSADDYVTTAVELFVRGIAGPEAPAKNRRNG